MARARTSPRKAPQQSRSQATVDALLEAGGRVLGQTGYARASVNRIAQTAGVSVGSLYQYFPTKEALVAAVAKRHSDRMIEIFQRDLADIAALPLPAAVRAVVERTLEAYALDPALRRVITHDVPQLRAMARPREFDAFLQEALVMYFAYHADRVRTANMKLAVRILRTAVEAIASEIVVGDEELPHSEELVAEVTWLVLRYVER